MPMAATGLVRTEAPPQRNSGLHPVYCWPRMGLGALGRTGSLGQDFLPIFSAIRDGRTRPKLVTRGSYELTDDGSTCTPGPMVELTETRFM